MGWESWERGTARGLTICSHANHKPRSWGVVDVASQVDFSIMSQKRYFALFSKNWQELLELETDNF